MAEEQYQYKEKTVSGGSCVGGTCGHWFCGNRDTRIFVTILLAILVCFFAVKIASEIREYKYIGQDPTQVATITVSGDADRYALPNLAEISYSVEYLGKTAKEAKDEVAKQSEALSAFVKSSGVADKDIQTTGFNLYPEYDYMQAQAVFCTQTYCPPQVPGKQVLRGYRVSQSVSIKIRNIDSAGDVLSGLAEKGATNISGLNFSIENSDALMAEARGEAITEAETKANALAKQLGVSIVRVQSFSEGFNYPYAYGRGGAEMKVMAQDSSSSIPPTIDPGQQKITSNVTISYVVR